jgi:NMD protein affecting ribosome stability and mRNA decay
MIAPSSVQRLADRLAAQCGAVLQQRAQAVAQHSQFDSDARELALLDLVVHKRSQARLQVQAAARARLRQERVSWREAMSLRTMVPTCDKCSRIGKRLRGPMERASRGSLPCAP